jgi:uncharacterized membrane protein
VSPRPTPAVILLGAGALWGALALPPLRAAFEGEMALQMTVQLPLLAVVGGAIAQALRSAEPGWLRDADRLGLCGVTLAVFAFAIWMLPRSLDGALADPLVEFAKFVSLPLFVGLPLASSWQRLPGLGRGFLVANFLSMLGAAGGLYLAAPIRLCAYYRIDQQEMTGRSLIALAVGIGLFALFAALFGWRWPAPAAGSRG